MHNLLMANEYIHTVKAIKSELKRLQAGNGDWVQCLLLLDRLDECVDYANSVQTKTATDLHTEFMQFTPNRAAL